MYLLEGETYATTDIQPQQQQKTPPTTELEYLYFNLFHLLQFRIHRINSIAVYIFTWLTGMKIVHI